MRDKLNRRDWLKGMGLMAVAAPAAGMAMKLGRPKWLGTAPDRQKPSRPIRFVVLGAGARGNIYAGYAKKYPDEMEIVGFAEPIPLRSQRFAKKYNIPQNRRFITWEHVFREPRFADAVIISTPDHLHYGPAMQAMAKGYQVLLEKPVAQSWQQCRDILNQSKKYQSIVAVCHVLRYTPYFRELKHVVESGALGEVVSAMHLEPIQHIHMTHSYVRGIWRKTKETNPAILAKSCHDLDILRWILDRPCESLASFGSLKWFRKENAPQGAPLRCTDGCPVERECPYSALKIYHQRRDWTYHMDLPEEKAAQGAAIMKELREGPYGRCVYHCDNDVVDHQTVMMRFQGDVTVNFNMEAFTGYHGRRTRIFGSMGDVVGDMDSMTVTDFKTRQSHQWKVSDHATIDSGHGGGDYGLVRDLIAAIDRKDPSLLTSTIDASMESHLMGFVAEESRRTGKILPVRL